jgi:hypothetical protein
MGPGLAARSGAVGDDEPHPSAEVGVEQDRFRAVPVLGRGSEDHHDQQQAQGVGDDDPLAGR